MSKKKSLRRSIIASLTAGLLSLTMLVGTTFAWFTDSVTSNNNLITAGNLDVELEYMDENGNWALVEEDTNVFKNDTLWEPGHTEVVYLKVSNAGSLSFNYKLGVKIKSEVASVNVADEPFKLSDFIKMGAVEGVDEAYDTRNDALNALTASEVVALSKGYAKEGVLYAVNDVPAIPGASSEEYVALVVYMPETVGDEANYKKGADVPTIMLGISLLATQYTYEEDSFDEKYDENANTTVPPVSVEKRTIEEVQVMDIMNTGLSTDPLQNVEMDVYTFDEKDYSTSHPLEDYGSWEADFYVSTDGPVEDGIMLIGSYGTFGWLGIWAPSNDQPYEPTPLLGSVTKNAWTYQDVADFVHIFDCGIIDRLGNNDGLGVTVELRITNPTNANDYIIVRSISVEL